MYDGDGLRQVFCSVIMPEQCDNQNIARTMHLYQEWVPKQYDVRLTVVDRRFFAVRIDAESREAHIDWRSDYRNLTYRDIETPDHVRSRVSALLDALDLRFGAFDFAVASDGEWWFLECNPNGQWAWIEDETGLPISGALVDALTGSVRHDGC